MTLRLKTSNATGAQQAGFTLVEILVVLVLIAFVSAIVVTSMTGTVRRGQQQDTLEEIAFFDRTTRQDTQRAGRGLNLIFDLENQQIRRVDLSGSDTRGEPLRMNSATGDESPRWLPINRVILGTQRDASTGQVSVAYSGRGISPSYAVEVGGAQSPKRWLVVAGMSGQTRIVDDEATAKAILGATRNAVP